MQLEGGFQSDTLIVGREPDYRYTMRQPSLIGFVRNTL